jgi:hypothetical protein
MFLSNKFTHSNEKIRPVIKFNKVKFIKNANSSCKRSLKNHVDTLEGREVDQNGEINYKIDGEKFYLYPVMPEWREEVQHG